MHIANASRNAIVPSANPEFYGCCCHDRSILRGLSQLISQRWLEAAWDESLFEGACRSASPSFWLPYTS